MEPGSSSPKALLQRLRVGREGMVQGSGVGAHRDADSDKMCGAGQQDVAAGGGSVGFGSMALSTTVAVQKDKRVRRQVAGATGSWLYSIHNEF